MIVTGEDEARRWAVTALGLSHDDCARLESFGALLLEEAQHQNLIAPSTFDQLWQRHFADSLQLLGVSRETDTPDGPWLDLGTGAGFPGLVVALVDPRPMLLVESRKRRIDWLERAKAHFALDHVAIIGAPLEKVPTQSAAVISARAFAPLDPLLDMAARFSTASTLWLLPKGRGADKELASVSPKWHHRFHVKQSMTDPDSGIIAGFLADQHR